MKMIASIETQPTAGKRAGSLYRTKRIRHHPAEHRPSGRCGVVAYKVLMAREVRQGNDSDSSETRLGRGKAFVAIWQGAQSVDLNEGAMGEFTALAPSTIDNQWRQCSDTTLFFSSLVCRSPRPLGSRAWSPALSISARFFSSWLGFCRGYFCGTIQARPQAQKHTQPCGCCDQRVRRLKIRPRA